MSTHTKPAASKSKDQKRSIFHFFRKSKSSKTEAVLPKSPQSNKTQEVQPLNSQPKTANQKTSSQDLDSTQRPSNPPGEIPAKMKNHDLHKDQMEQEVTESDLHEPDPKTKNEPGHKNEGPEVEDSKDDQIEAHPEPPRDLWELAWNSDNLSDEDKGILEEKWDDTYSEDEKALKGTEKFVEHVITLTSEKVGAYKKRWTIKAADGKSINIRDKANSILVSVLTIKSLIDAGVKFDPTGHAASAWMILSLGLKMVQNDKDLMDATFEAPDYLANVLARYAHYEKYYRQPAIKDSEKLEGAIVDVYVAVLQYSARVKKQVQLSTPKRIIKSLRALAEDPLQSLKDAVKEHDSSVQEWRSIIENQFRIAESEKIGKHVDSLLRSVDAAMKDLSDIKAAVNSERWQRMMRWLYKNDEDSGTSKHQPLRDAIKRGKAQSGKWLLKSEKYIEWMQYPQGLLWSWGNSGCGKSSLCSTIIESLQDACVKDTSKILMYWYFSFDKVPTQSINQLLRSFLRQLGADGNFPSESDGKPEETPEDMVDVLDYLEYCQRNDRVPDTQKMIKALDPIISHSTKNIFIVLDGLDEFPENSKYGNRSDLLDLIRTLVTQPYSKNLHVLVASKAEDDIKSFFDWLGGTVDRMDVEEGISEDLDSFIDAAMNLDPKLSSLDVDLKEAIESRLNEGESRKFLWVSLLLEDLRSCEGNARKIQEKLRSIPGDMVKLYESEFKNVKPDDAATMQAIITWLLRSMRPLMPEEIAAAVKLENPKDIQKICKSTLVSSSTEVLRIDGQEKPCEVLRFVHFSLKEYLESKELKDSADPKIAQFFVSDEAAHTVISETCLSYLLEHNLDLSESEELRPSMPLLQYSAMFWFKHFKLIPDYGHATKIEGLKNLVYKLFQTNSPNYTSWLRSFNPDDQIASPDSGDDDSESSSDGGSEFTGFPQPVYYALQIGLLDVARHLISQNAEINAPGGREGTVLQMASYRGLNDIVSLLLDNKAEVNVDGKAHGSALYAASAQGHENVVDALLSANATMNNERARFGNALQVSSYRGHVGIVERLLKNRAPVNAIGGVFHTALQAASAAGNSQIVEMLVDNGADVNVVGGLLGTALQAVLAGGIHDDSHNDSILRSLRSGGGSLL